VIVPSIDLMGGQTVQLVGGRDKALEAGDPLPIAERLRLAGEIAVIDLDAALGQGSNRELIEKLLRVARCRVGGGIRDLQTARRWLDLGASKVILGTRAVPEILRELPRERVIAALDADHGEVVVEGWRTGTGRRVEDRMRELEGLVGGFLVTFVEREGRLGGPADDERVKALVAAAKDARLTVAGGVTTAAEIGRLDRLGAEAQVGMALYTGRLDLADAIAAPLLASDADGSIAARWATALVDRRGVLLTLRRSSMETLRRAVAERRAHALDGSSPPVLLGVDLDAERSGLRFVVDGPAGQSFELPGGLRGLEERLRARLANPPPGSYTARLLGDPGLLAAKLVEEARELAEARSAADVTHETADILYFALVAMVRGGASLAEVEAELDRRGQKLERRPGDAKPAP
jgi:phosphoribosyl-ATP pyrophosphohydrolase